MSQWRGLLILFLSEPRGILICLILRSLVLVREGGGQMYDCSGILNFLRQSIIWKPVWSIGVPELDRDVWGDFLEQASFEALVSISCVFCYI